MHLLFDLYKAKALKTTMSGFMVLRGQPRKSLAHNLRKTSCLFLQNKQNAYTYMYIYFHTIHVNELVFAVPQSEAAAGLPGMFESQAAY